MARKLRTAVLVVHGMGSQRPLETVRGIINAVWFDNDDHLKDSTHRLWSHPEPSGVDLDLTVMTTNEIPGIRDGRVADFHELYWAHQMSETKAVAVLLWLFELGRRGPHFKTGMNGLWWCAAVYLCLMLLSVSLLTLQALVWITGIGKTPYDFISVVMLMILIGVAASAIAAYWYAYRKLCLALVLVLAVAIGAACLAWGYGLFTSGTAGPAVAAWLTNAFFAPILALVAVFILMKGPGLRAFGMAYGFSLIFFVIFLALRWATGGWSRVYDALLVADVAWGLPSHASTIAALTVLAVYLVINAGFLQPYLGDAACYFRNSPANVAARRAIRKNAVDTLDQLHRSRDYDRIVVVAHSLGTAVAYDMLRAYYSGICNQIPLRKYKPDPQFEQLVSTIDGRAVDCGSRRRLGRELVCALARRSEILRDDARQGLYKPAASEEVDAWLVTDFVTLGSPLTHAKYLMTNEEDGSKLERAFADHVREREFPTTPPQLLYGDGHLVFTDRNTGTSHLHHGGMFAMTRWTNLYFPVSNIFWGDAIGGPVEPVFGGCDTDRVVTTKRLGGSIFFSHVAYWKTDCRPDLRDAPHLRALIGAIDLADRDKPAQP